MPCTAPISFSGGSPAALPAVVPGGPERPQLSPESEAGWQPELWRRLRHRLGVPSPAERLEDACRRLVLEPELLELPARLSLFGLTRLPASHLRVLEAIAHRRDVHLFLLHPSGALWDSVTARIESLPVTAAGWRRPDDPTAALPANPLLRSWGRDAREMQLVLASHGVGGGEHRSVPAGEAQGHLLGLIQADVRADRSPPGAPKPGAADARPVLREGDDSLRIHACHGRARQVEVMRDAVLHLLAEDPTLEPRDVIVMCPDIESFAPLVHAAFGVAASVGEHAARRSGQGEPGVPSPGVPELRVRLADRSIRQTNPLLAAAAHLLELADSRVTASDVVDFISREPVSRRFRFDEDDLAQVERWVSATGIRWGFDAEHRKPWKLDDVDANTWAMGLDRLLLGAAMTEEDERLFGGVLPFEGVSSGAVDVAGRLAELVSRLQSALDALAGSRPVSEWTSLLAAATESLALAAPADAWQHDQLRRLLDDVAGSAGGADGATESAPLDIAELRALLDDRLRGRPTRANFRTGDLTICTLVPMRSVPHRVVGLLGLDEGAFPRHSDQDGDDLLLGDPHVGDRDARSEDRQLLLDALMAAADQLIVTYEGHDPRTNQERPPAVPVSELLDIVDKTVRRPDGGGDARLEVVVEHPLQAFDGRNFVPDGLVPGGPWSFDRINLDGAKALAAGSRPGRPFLEHPLAPLQLPVVQLESLVRFLEHPVRAFLRERLGLFLGGGAEQVPDALPVELDALERWGVGDRLLEARLGGADLDRAVTAEVGRGLLPPGSLADGLLADLAMNVEALVSAVEAESPASAERRSVEINVVLPDGRPLIGTVPDVRGGTILRCVYSRLAAKHRLAAWARFLALTASQELLEVSAVTIGRGAGNSAHGPRLVTARLEPLEGGAQGRRAEALALLGSLVELYERGMRQPLPLYCATSAAWAQASLRDEDPFEAGRRTWESSLFAPGEDADPEHVLVLGPAVPLHELARTPPAADEMGAAWPAGERWRLGRYALSLWGGLLDHERLR